ncbi:MAG: inositol monophosphatase family protein [Marmoricola sp.]
MALIATGFGYDAALRAQQGACVACFAAQMCVTSAGSAHVLSTCAVSQKAPVNGYVEEGPQPWDYAAGQVIVEAAGGSV